MMGRWGLLKVGLVIVLFVSISYHSIGLAEGRYTVKSGDTLYGISKALGVSIEALKLANHLEGDSLKPKQVLVIPPQSPKHTDEPAPKSPDQRIKKPSTEIVKKPTVETGSYTVEKGDSLYSISKKMGLSIEEIKKMNSLHSPLLKIGQRLLLPKHLVGDNDEVEESGDGEEIGRLSQSEGEKRDQESPAPLGKWNNPEERSLFIRVVKTFLGVPYRLGGSTLKGIDCSAFVKKIYEIFNVDLPRTTREQFCIGKQIEKDQLEEGDLVFFRRRGNSAHVGIYIGDKQFVHASSHNREVKIDHLDAPYYHKRFLRGVRVKELERES